MKFFLLALFLALPVAVQTQAVVIEGAVEIVIEDRFDGTAVTRHTLVAGNSGVELEFTNGAPPDLKHGTRVRVRGQRIGQALHLNREDLELVEAIAPNTFGSQSTLVILMNLVLWGHR